MLKNEVTEHVDDLNASKNSCRNSDEIIHTHETLMKNQEAEVLRSGDADNFDDTLNMLDELAQNPEFSIVLEKSD